MSESDTKKYKKSLDKNKQKLHHTTEIYSPSPSPGVIFGGGATFGSL